MPASSKPLPTWLKWVMRVLSVVMLLSLLARLPFTILATLVIVAIVKEKGISAAAQTSAVAYMAGHYVAMILWGWAGVWMLRRSWRKPADGLSNAPPSRPEPAAAGAGPARPARRAGASRGGTCNILMPGAQIRQLWQFNTGGRFSLLRQESKLPSEPLPEKAISKDWHSLFQPRLNVAWLSSEKVFLRVVQFPKADLAETQSMVELQLEKLSPLPVTQIVWSFEVMPFVSQGGASDHLNPHATGEQQTVVVITALRSHVEEFLGHLESQGFLADRLELPMVDELRATRVRENGAWVFPGIGGQEGACMVAWWYDGVLQTLSLLHLPEYEKRAVALREQLDQTTWAGEMEGWLTSQPKIHLVADEATAAQWLPLFDPNTPAEVVVPVAPQELAAMTARRVSGGETNTNLLPAEFATRYKARFVDRLWMRGLGAVLMIYVVGAMIYMGLVTWASMRFDSVQSEARGYSLQYTNTLQIREKLHVLQETLDLQYAALESYKAAADFLPPELTLDTMIFGGQKVTFRGTGGTDDRSKVSEFNAALQKVEVNGQLLFAKVAFGNVNNKPGNQIDWSISCELRRADE